MARSAFMTCASAMAFSLTALAATSDQAMANDYDNPTMGGIPCVVMNDYDVSKRGAGDARTYSAKVVLENVCARAMETELCFFLMPSEDEDAQTSICDDMSVRPYGKETVRLGGVESRILTAEYNWRALAVE